jgi:hypothetical protein
MRQSIWFVLAIASASVACGGRQKGSSSPALAEAPPRAGVTEAECRQAVEHYLELGYAEATAEERAELEASGEELYEAAVRECLRLDDRRTTQCWMAAQSTDEVEGCGD